MNETKYTILQYKYTIFSGIINIFLFASKEEKILQGHQIWPDHFFSC